MTTRSRVLSCALAALGFVAVEGAVGLLRPAPGIGVRAEDALGAVLLLGGPAAALGLTRAGPRLVALGLLALALPRTERLCGEHGLVLALGLLGGGLVLAAPRLALAFAALSGALTPALLPLRDEGVPGEAAGGPDRLLLTIDTLRADAPLRLPEGAWLSFEQAVAPAPWTLPSVHSLMRGQPVRAHGGGLPREGGFTAPAEDSPPLAEVLAAQGVHTAAFVSNPHLRAELGVDRGFSHFDHADAWVEPFTALDGLFLWRFRLFGVVERLRHDRDALLVEAALRWWEDTPAPRFAWVHLLLPHEYQRDPRGHGEPGDRYRANVQATNPTLARLLEGVGPDVLVAVTADHGESLGEDGRWGHGSALDDPQLRVPLALRGFGAGEVSRQVALTDLAGALIRGDAGALSRGHPVVEVGGLRRPVEGQRGWALRLEGGGYTDREAPSGAPDVVQPVSDGLIEALRALGYTP